MATQCHAPSTAGALPESPLCLPSQLAAAEKEECLGPTSGLLIQEVWEVPDNCVKRARTRAHTILIMVLILKSMDFGS